MNAYALAAATLLREEDVRVRATRSSTTGVAHRDGTITVPDARGPISFGVFAHEVGHVVRDHVRKGDRTPRWIEEVEAWEYALFQMTRFGLAGYDRVYVRAAQCLAYSFSKAIRRGVDADAIRDRFPSWYSDALTHDRYGRLRALTS